MMVNKLELLAKLEHDQWVGWTKQIFNEWGYNLPEPLIRRWSRNWIAYEELSEADKEKDRQLAREVLEALNEKG